MFNKGRRVRTDGIFWFVALYSLAGMRRYRRSLPPRGRGGAHRQEWLTPAARGRFAANYDLGVEVVRAVAG